jgi:hypothetical protein
MRDQYAGDISDFLKFSLLRSIVAQGTRLGIAWYYVAGHDKRPDGRHLEYLDERSWRDLDPHLYDALASIRNNRSVRALEELEIWGPSTLFHSDAVETVSKRDTWAEGMANHLKASDVIFADPDNGLSNDGVVHRKSATLGEINLLSALERPVILIRFPSRKGKHLEQLERHHLRLASFRPVTLRTCVTVRNRNGSASPRIRWFSILNASAEIRRNIHDFQQRLASIGGAKAEVAGLQ